MTTSTARIIVLPVATQRVPRSALLPVLAVSLASLASLALLSLGPPSAVAAAKECGVYHSKGGPYAVRVLHRPVSCRSARRVLHGYVTSHKRRQGSGCHRRIRGWRCATGGAGAFPRLFSCQRGKRQVAAYSIAD